MIQSYIRHLSLLPNAQVGAQTKRDYTKCFRAMKPRQDHAVEYIAGEPVPEEGIFIRTSSLVGFYDPDNQRIPERIQLTGHQLEAIFQGEIKRVSDGLDDDDDDDIFQGDGEVVSDGLDDDDDGDDDDDIEL
ncbi:hypothetical protein TRICI_003784 [Trichomonascus ciferrii]|uniref:Uncharacterized protein n=1 Tax=Trichomonascus ciferrii TaxID=44093 RepID=A0A642V2T8_9ASCO|nr:hypothetical protein TRICI_003784 [Trichomonascus ciferrii]